MNQRVSKEKGITLIALVITIIVLLILAGVTINIAVNSGIMDKSEKAVSRYTEQQAREKLAIALLDYQMGMLTGGTADLQSYLSEIGGVVTIEDADNYTVELDGYELLVSKDDLEVTSLGTLEGEKPNVGTPSVSLSSDKFSATITVSASATQGGKITVTIGGETATNNGDGTYSKTVEQNGKYSILVSEEGGRKAATSVEVTEILNCTISLTKGTGVSTVKINNKEATGSVEKGKSVTISATVESGYEFEKWIIADGTGTIENAASASTTVTVNGNITIQATAKTPIISNGNNTSGTENGTTTGNLYAYNNPVIPVGFKTSTAGASWTVSNGIVTGWNDGLVIQDSSGNEFVWVPVDNANVTYNKWLGEKNNSNITSLDVLSDDSLPTKVTSTSEWNQNETSQITKYGGFYIARYEAGIPSTLSTAQTTASADARNVSGTPVSKQNQVPWNYISYTQSKTNAESMYSTNYVQSGLVTGKMWDATMKWLENASVNVQTDSTAWGNYYDVTVTGITQYSTNYGASWTSASSKPSSNAYLLKTGNSDYTKRKNIYDLAGNLWEWTNEIYSSDRVFRGGFCNGNGSNIPAAYRYYNTTTNTNYYIGFRVGLYIK